MPDVVSVLHLEGALPCHVLEDYNAVDKAQMFSLWPILSTLPFFFKLLYLSRFSNVCLFR